MGEGIRSLLPFPPGKSCEAKWTLVLHLTVNPQGFRRFNLPDVGWKKGKERKKKEGKTFNWLYKLCGFFSTGRLKCLCVLCLPWASPREQSPFKRISKEDKSLLIQGRQKYNSHDMLSSSHAPTDWGAFVTSSASRWEACCACRLSPQRLRSIQPSGYIWGWLSPLPPSKRYGFFFFCRVATLTGALKNERKK